MFAILATMLMLATGLAVDGAYYLDSKRILDQALDQAALAATSDVRRALLTSTTSSGPAVQKAQGIARNMFNLTAGQRGNVTLNNFSPELTVSGQTIEADFTYTATFRPFVLRVGGAEGLRLAGRVATKANVLPYVEVVLLVDTSGSMAIGVDSAAQDSLRTATGCSFACHDGVRFGKYADTYAYAKASGIPLRFDAVNAALVSLIDRFNSVDPTAKYIKASIWSFDTVFRQNQSMTNSRSTLKRRLPTTPSMSNETDAATRFREGIATVVNALGRGGDGSSPTSPIKLVILATDGVEDPGRSWTWNLPLRPYVDAFDMSFCSSLKSVDVRIGIVHTPYIPMPWDWGYMATLGMPSQKGGRGARVDDIAPALRDCAGSNYHVATDQAGITNGFQAVFSNLIIPHLTQ